MSQHQLPVQLGFLLHLRRDADPSIGQSSVRKKTQLITPKDKYKDNDMLFDVEACNFRSSDKRQVHRR